MTEMRQPAHVRGRPHDGSLSMLGIAANRPERKSELGLPAGI